MKAFLLCIPLWVFVLSACVDTNDSEDCYYDDCQTTYPYTGTLRVKISLNGASTSVPIKIYAGYYGEGELIEEDTMYSETKHYELPSGVYYSVAATYKTSQGDITVVDGDKIDVESRRECDSTCYSVHDAKVNLKLQY